MSRTRAGAVRERRRGLRRHPEAGRRLQPGRRVPGRAVRHARAGGGARRSRARRRPIRSTGSSGRIYGYTRDRRRYLPLKDPPHPPFDEVWQFSGNVLLEFPPVIGGKRLYLLNDHGKLFCIDKRTGKVRWRRKLGALAAASPAYADGKVYVVLLQRAETRRRRQGRPRRGARRQVRQGRVEQQAREPQRVLPARRRRPALLRRRERHGLRDGHAHGTHPLAVPGRRRGQGRRRARRRQALLRRLRRAHLRDPRVRRPQGVGVVEHLGRVRDRGRQLLLHARRRLRPRLHRQHQRQHLLLQRDERQARLEPRHRRLRLRLTRRRAGPRRPPARLRGLVQRPLLRARRALGPRGLVARRQRQDLRRGDRDRRHRLLRRPRQAPDGRARRPQRPQGLRARARLLQPGRLRRADDLPHRLPRALRAARADGGGQEGARRPPPRRAPPATRRSGAPARRSPSRSHRGKPKAIRRSVERCVDRKRARRRAAKRHECAKVARKAHKGQKAKIRRSYERCLVRKGLRQSA